MVLVQQALGAPAGHSPRAVSRDWRGNQGSRTYERCAPDLAWIENAFDPACNQELFKDCGLLYYGCCEPMDRQIDLLLDNFRLARQVLDSGRTLDVLAALWRGGTPAGMVPACCSKNPLPRLPTRVETRGGNFFRRACV
jgi:hypothetical protein